MATRPSTGLPCCTSRNIVVLVLFCLGIASVMVSDSTAAFRGGGMQGGPEEPGEHEPVPTRALEQTGLLSESVEKSSAIEAVVPEVLASAEEGSSSRRREQEGHRSQTVEDLKDNLLNSEESPASSDTGNVAAKQGTALSSKNIYEPPGKMPTIYSWNGLAKHVPFPKENDWFSETQFLERVLRAFGKQRQGYRGQQRMDGFQPGKIFDDNGMFAFDSSVKSVAFDVGAATNPLTFDLDIDMSQVAFFVEPLQWKTLEASIETDTYFMKRRGGCVKLNEGCNTTSRDGCVQHWDGVCVMNRFLVFPAAVSHNVGRAKFHATGNPYCGSLEAFTEDTDKGAIDKSLKNNKDTTIPAIFGACYKDAGKPSDVPTISLKALIERIPKHILIKYVKIDAQGHDFKSFLSAGDQISRIDYVRFEMQVDPPEGMRLVKDIPSYKEVEQQMSDLGFKHAPGHACHFDHGASPFSKAVKEMECVFCRKLPCQEGQQPPLGKSPSSIAARNKAMAAKAERK